MKLDNSNGDKTFKTSMVSKLKKLKLGQKNQIMKNSKSQNVTISNCKKTQIGTKLKLWKKLKL